MLHSFRSNAFIFSRLLIIVIMLLVDLFPQQHFVDETATRLPQLEDISVGADVGDVNRDGYNDIIVANTPFTVIGQNRLLINNGSGLFTDESSERLPSYNDDTRDVDFLDADGDGDMDLFVTNLFLSDIEITNVLFINDGAGYFVDESETRLPPPKDISIKSAWGDVDLDGDVDIFVGSYPQNFLWINVGEGYFVDSTLSLLPQDSIYSNIIFFDADGDNDLDYVTANRTGSLYQNRLFINDDSGHFTDETDFRMPTF